MGAVNQRVPDNIKISTAQARKDLIKELENMGEGDDVYITLATERSRPHRYTIVQKTIGELLLERQKEESE